MSLYLSVKKGLFENFFSSGKWQKIEIVELSLVTQSLIINS